MSRLQDLQLLLQNDRRIWVISGIVLAGAAIWLFVGGDTRRFDQPGIPTAEVGSPSISSDTAYKDIVRVFQEELRSNKQKTDANEEALRVLADDQSKFQEQAKGIFDQIIKNLETVNTKLDNIPQSPVGDQGGNAQVNVEGVPAEEPQELETIGFDKTDLPPPPPPPANARIAVISPTDVVKLTNLTGVYAPVDGTPYPVVFKLTGPITGSDGSTLDLGEARLIAAATGSETNGRALFRLTDLAFRHPDGRRSVVKVDGWIVGEDGIQGMSGKLIDKLGRLIAATAAVSGVAALAERLDQESDQIEVNTTGDVNVDADDMTVAATSAITDASNRLGQILLDRYEKLVPVVEVLSGREVYAVFSETTEVYVIDEDQFGEGVYQASLD